ncbi:MAG: dihydroneopterin aldolase [Alphaproteobacteria bacterium]|nr:dihydroneopterin aldolase [Alphaproteobacteria bacterium]MCZ6764948.1 dihydroneopterin aldolase [Alphaproteobacteria bacterium]
MTGPQLPIDALEAKLIADGKRVRRIFFRDFVLEVPIGVHESELGAPQRIAINLSLYVADDPAGDDLAQVFDYDRVRRAITRLARRNHINLQETLVEAIAETCLGFEEVLGVRASTQKLDIYANCAGVGIEIVRLRDE